MQNYELIFILKAQLDERKQNELIEKIKAIVSANGEITQAQVLGKKTLAVKFKKQTQGIYAQIEFSSKNKEINKIIVEFFKVQEDVLRYLLIKQDNKVVKVKTKKVKKEKQTEVLANEPA